MSRNSIFDPSGPNTERSGNTFSGPDAAQLSHMPESAIDGVVEKPRADTVEFDAAGNPVTPPPVAPPEDE